MFRAYLGPSSGDKPYVYKNWYLLFFVDDFCPGWIVFSDDCCLVWIGANPIRTTGSHLKKNNKYQMLYTYGCTS